MIMTCSRARGFESEPLNMMRSVHTANVHVKMQMRHACDYQLGTRGQKVVYGVQSSTLYVHGPQ